MAAKKPTKTVGFMVKIGAFANMANVTNIINKTNNLPFKIETLAVPIGEQTLTSVRTEVFSSKDDALKAQKMLSDIGFSSIITSVK
jgi:cell division septation protein DedD